MTKRWGLFLLVTILVVSLVTGCGGKKPETKVEQEKAAAVAVASVAKGEIIDQIKLGGNLKANQEVNLIAKYGGKIESVSVSVGDKVANGQVLVRLEIMLNILQR